MIIFVIAGMIETMLTYARYNPFQYDPEAYESWAKQTATAKQRRPLKLGGWYGGQPDALDWNTLAKELPSHFNLERVDHFLKMQGPGTKLAKPNLKVRMKSKALRGKFTKSENKLPLDFKTWLHHARASISAAMEEPAEYPQDTPEYQMFQQQQQALDTPLLEGGDVAEVKVPGNATRLDEQACGLRTVHRFCARDLLVRTQYPEDELPEYNLAHLFLPAALHDRDNLETLFDNIALWGSSQYLTVLVIS